MRGGLGFSESRRPTGEGAIAALDRHLLRNDSTPVAVAVSGGGDSLALLRMAATWAEQARRPLLALAVDHGLSPLSADWTRFAETCAGRHGAAFRALSWEGTKPSHGLQAAARGARHALLARAAREAGAGVILFAHTADDHDETEHMRQGDAPGIGRLRPWSPSPAWPQGRGVMLLRPLLGVRRRALRDWLMAQDQSWIDDPANDDERFARVRARRSAPSVAPVIDLQEAGVATLARTAAFSPAGTLTLDPFALARAPEGAARHVVSAAVVCAGGGATVPRRAQVDGLRLKLATGEPLVAQLCGARIERSGDRLAIGREPGDARRNPRSVVDGVTDGLFEDDRCLAADRFRAATFQIADEAQLRTSVWP